MLAKTPTKGQVLFCVALSFVFFALIFGMQIINFWAGIGFASAVLVSLSLYFAGLPLFRSEFTAGNVLLGATSAGILYGLFALCYFLLGGMWNPAWQGVLGIYELRAQAHPLVVSLVLVFLTSPAEELFWRGFVQRWSMEWLGKKQGLLLASLCHALALVPSMNPMLIGAAFAAGLFWGSVYILSKSIFACIISHAIWAIAIFILWPLV